MLDKLQKLINNGTVMVGQENGLYELRTPILLEKELLPVVEDFSVEADQKSLVRKECLIIVDFSVLVFNKTQYFKNYLPNTVLSDGKRNYFPIKVIKTEEKTISGHLHLRFDLVYSVPISSRVFELTFFTGLLESIKKTRFKVDINSLEDKAKNGTLGGCMFFTNDDPTITA